MDLWTRTTYPLCHLHSLHVWGSPTYFLHKNLSNGKSIGRWHPPSQPCANLGLSKQHATKVPLVLNPVTSNITPQQNVCFDDYFTTIASSDEDLPDFHATEWRDLFGTSTYHFPDDSADSISPSPLPSKVPPLLEEIANYTPPTPLQLLPDPDPAPSSTPGVIVPYAPSLPLSRVTPPIAPHSQQEEISNFVDNDLQIINLFTSAI